jgi:hypothetical protein
LRSPYPQKKKKRALFGVPHNPKNNKRNLKKKKSPSSRNREIFSLSTNLTPRMPPAAPPKKKRKKEKIFTFQKTEKI